MSLSPPSDRLSSPLDLEHLDRMTLGDAALRREVLAMFLKQTGELLASLKAEPGERARQAHTLKGSARAIGAFGVATCAEALEAAIRTGIDPSPALAQLETATMATRGAIEGILAQP